MKKCLGGTLTSVVLLWAARRTNAAIIVTADAARTAVAAIGLGFYISISGIVTFKSAGAVREVAKRLPLDRLLIETDAPWLAPVPKRGRQNEPAFVRYTAEFLANLREITVDELAEGTSNNFFRLFGI